MSLSASEHTELIELLAPLHAGEPELLTRDEARHLAALVDLLHSYSNSTIVGAEDEGNGQVSLDLADGRVVVVTVVTTSDGGKA